MNCLATIGLGLIGALAGVPVAAIAYSTPASGPVGLPARWWTGSPAQPGTVLTTAALTATTAAIVGATVPTGIALPAFWAFAILGVGLAIIDVRRRRLPHRLTGALWALCGLSFLGASIVNGSIEPLLRAAGVGVATITIMLTIALALPGQLGFGDVVFAGAVTFSLAWLSWHAAVLGLLAGLFIQAAVAGAVGIRRRDAAVAPMGPALMAGWLLGVAGSP
ncbi:prepilin peptidase [Polymorphospora rubra]|uniref:prepilin peptidase n=1 Tax=Polymorphospora rubra TaxID=338584 RepID=UPI0033CF7D23